MNKLFNLLFSLLFMTAFGQSKLKVMQAGSQNPISGATVACNNKILGKTNSAGIFEFRTKCKSVEVKARGFYEADVVVDKVMEVTLSKTDPKVQSIETVMINDKSDPKALEILAKVNDRYQDNSPQSLDSYSFKSYEKISYDFDEDSITDYRKSISRKMDSLKLVPNFQLDKKKAQDSIEDVKLMKLMVKSKLFLWERASEFLFAKKYGEKINILDNRVAGLNQPVYEMLSLRSNRNRLPREIRLENRSLYRYFLTDSIDIEGRKNYVIRFRQADNKKLAQQRKFNGYLYVDAETYGLKKIESNSTKRNDGSITSIWKPVHDKWFLYKENLKLRMGTTYLEEKYKKDEKTGDKTENKNRKNFGNYVFMTADYFDFQTPVQENKRDFSGYTMTVKNSDGTMLEKFRTDSLTTREKQTYTKIDSVGKKYSLDQKLNVFAGLLRGDLRVGIVDFELPALAKYNKYEGLRVGVKAKLNERFNRYISPDAYVAYGFHDKEWKYGVGVDLRTTLEKNSFFRAEYYNDVMPAGAFSENLWNYKIKILNSGVDLNNYNFYHYDGFKLSYENDLTNSLTMNVSLKRDNEESKFLYNFMNLGDNFKNFASKITLKYAPNSKNLMTPGGKLTYDIQLPEYYVNYEQGFKGFGGDLTYSRLDALMVTKFNTKLGSTGFRVYGGMLFGDAPIWHNFMMSGLGDGKNELNYNFTSYLGFATMQGGKYYNDKFVGYYFTHNLPWHFRTFGKTTSSFDLIYKGTIGDMKHPEYHQFEFEKMDHLYQEVGLEWNNFFSGFLNLGAFYRVGYYNTPNFLENFALQLKFNFLGF